jgi:uroporphyrinogen-III synthase
MVAALAKLGAESVVAATTIIEDVVGPERDALTRSLLAASNFDWLFLTSANSVHACERLLRNLGRDMAVLSELKIAVVGESTEEALVDCGLRATLRARRSSSEGLAQLLVEEETDTASRILFPRAESGRDEAVQILRAAGYELALHTAYRSKTVDPDDADLLAALDALRTGALHAAAFFAPSQVSALCELAPDAAEELAKLEVIAAIGKTTAAALEELGLCVNAVATRPIPEQLADQILQAFS